MAEINPASMASQLATAYTQSTQALLTSQVKAARNTSSALTRLQSALRSFDTALSTLSSKGGVQQMSATLSATGFASASASSTAQTGRYQLFVEQLASAHQVAFEDLPAVPVATGGPIHIQLADGSGFTVNLGAADTDNDGTLSQAEIARSINQASGNGGKVTAMILTVGGSAQLVLTSGQTGAAGAVSVDSTDLPVGALKTALGAATELTAARDAVAWLGSPGAGLRVQQPTNALNAIPGVSITLTQTMTPGTPPLTLDITRDDSATAGRVKEFIDAYNTLEKTLDELTRPGSADGSTAAGAFASDSSVRALRSHLNSLLRQDIGGLTLQRYGITADRYGQLSVDSSRLNAALANDPSGLDRVLGKTGLTNSSGVLGHMNQYLNGWLNSASGQIKRRQDNVQKVQKSLAERQTRLDTQYSAYYERYLAQFTRLQSLQSQMSQTTGLLSNAFSV